MKTDKLAKALLSDHVCQTCVAWFYKRECPHPLHPKENTCESWNKPGRETEMLLASLMKAEIEKAKFKAMRKAMAEADVLDD
jgi:hypothetical protein